MSNYGHCKSEKQHQRCMYHCEHFHPPASTFIDLSLTNLKYILLQASFCPPVSKAWGLSGGPYQPLCVCFKPVEQHPPGIFEFLDSFRSLCSVRIRVMCLPGSIALFSPLLLAVRIFAFGTSTMAGNLVREDDSLLQLVSLVP